MIIINTSIMMGRIYRRINTGYKVQEVKGKRCGIMRIMRSMTYKNKLAAGRLLAPQSTVKSISMPEEAL